MSETSEQKMKKSKKDSNKSEQSEEDYSHAFKDITIKEKFDATELPPFNVDKLRELFQEEETNRFHHEATIRAGYLKGGQPVPKTITFKKQDYEISYPKTIEYLLTNVFKTYDGTILVKTFTSSGQVMPVELTEKKFSVYTKLFPKDIFVYWEQHNTKMFKIVLEPLQPFTYLKNGINYLNMFTGFRFQGKTRNDGVCFKHKDNVAFYWNHIRSVWCRDQDIQFCYIQNWIRTMIAKMRKMETALYIKGKMGIGKGLPILALMGILGKGNCANITDPDQIFGTFNPLLMGKLLCILNEMIDNALDARQAYNKLKELITGDSLPIRDLFKSPVVIKNVLCFILTGNHDMLSIEVETGKDRRLCIVDCMTKLMSDVYYEKLKDLVSNEEFQEALYWDCVEHCPRDWNEHTELKKLPMSETKSRMLIKALPTSFKFLKSLFEPATDDMERTFWEDGHLKKHLHAMYSAWNQSENCNRNRNIPSLNLTDFCAQLRESDFADCIQEGNFYNRTLKYTCNSAFKFDGPTLFGKFVRNGWVSKDEVSGYRSNFQEIYHKMQGPTQTTELIEDKCSILMRELQEKRRELYLLEKKFVEIMDEKMHSKQNKPREIINVETEVVLQLPATTVPDWSMRIDNGGGKTTMCPVEAFLESDKYKNNRLKVIRKVRKVVKDTDDLLHGVNTDNQSAPQEDAPSVVDYSSTIYSDFKERIKGNYFTGDFA